MWLPPALGMAVAILWEQQGRAHWDSLLQSQEQGPNLVPEKSLGVFV